MQSDFARKNLNKPCRSKQLAAKRTGGDYLGVFLAITVIFETILQPSLTLMKCGIVASALAE